MQNLPLNGAHKYNLIIRGLMGGKLFSIIRP